jgi:hypothetical protein
MRKSGPLRDWKAAARNSSRRFGGKARPVEVTIGKDAPADAPADPDEITLETPDEVAFVREQLRAGKPRDAIRAAVLERRASA